MTDDSKHCTVALTVSASGKMLTPIVVYKGTRHGRIATHKIHDHPQGLKYVMQPKAWFDEATMLDWVDDVLKPYVATAPVGIIPILFLDSFKIHLLGVGMSDCCLQGIKPCEWKGKRAPMD